MNIGNVAYKMNPYMAIGKPVSQTKKNDFHNAMSSVEAPSKTLQLHGVWGSTDEEGNKVIGAWADAVTGTNATVYKPEDFDPENPRYVMKIWDGDNLIEERNIDISEVDGKHGDTFDMYAYACHLSDSGEYPDAVTKFFVMEGPGTSYESDYDASALFEKRDWLSLIKRFMEMQYDVGNIKGYLDYKQFYDFLNL